MVMCVCVFKGRDKCDCGGRIWEKNTLVFKWHHSRVYILWADYVKNNLCVCVRSHKPGWLYFQKWYLCSQWASSLSDLLISPSFFLPFEVRCRPCRAFPHDLISNAVSKRDRKEGLPGIYPSLTNVWFVKCKAMTCYTLIRLPTRSCHFLLMKEDLSFSTLHTVCL